MTVKELIEKLSQFPGQWEIMVSEEGTDYCTEIDEIGEMTAPKFDHLGEIIGESGIGELEIKTR